MKPVGFRYFLGAAGLCLCFVPGLRAQFHSQKANGATAMNNQTVRAAQMQGAQAGMARAGAARGGSSTATGGGLSGGDMILPPGASEAFRENNVHLGVMNGKPVDVWARSINHSDGSYTLSREDTVSNLLKQETYSKNKVLLQTRMVSLDDQGRPGEVMIYDGRSQFKYRGVQVYDQLGRFSEEQLYDSKGTLIRRKVQGYDPRGAKMPLRSWDYVANVPPDLQLVITQENATATGSSGAGPMAATAAPPAPAASGTATASGEKPKGLGFRLFGGKKK